MVCGVSKQRREGNGRGCHSRGVASARASRKERPVPARVAALVAPGSFFIGGGGHGQMSRWGWKTLHVVGVLCVAGHKPRSATRRARPSITSAKRMVPVCWIPNRTAQVGARIVCQRHRRGDKWDRKSRVHAATVGLAAEGVSSGLPPRGFVSTSGGDDQVSRRSWAQIGDGVGCRKGCKLDDAETKLASGSRPFCW